MHRHIIKHCRACGTSVELRVPDDGDTRERAVCPACGTIHYVNPLLVVGTVPYLGDQVLLCKRAIEPRYGKWTLPAGFMENDETTAQAAARETLEEACARIEVGELYTLIDVPHISQVHIIYRARLLDLDVRAGEESLEVGLFTEDEIPWEQIAFRSIAISLRHFFADRRSGQWSVHTASLAPPPPDWR